MKLFKTLRNTSSIGIIGGADGPTAIFISKTQKHGQPAKQDDFLWRAQQSILPCERSFSQLAAHLVEIHHATPCTLSPGELENLKVNVLLNHYPKLLEEIPAPEGMSEFEIPFFRAHAYPVEKLEFHPKAFTLPDIFPQPRPVKKSLWKRRRASVQSLQPAIVQWEETSGYLCIHNGDDKIMDEIILFLGVSEQDIREKSPRFVSYAYTLKKLGKLEN